MASVRLTQDLQQQILNKVNSAFVKPLETANNTLSPTFGDRCYKYVLRKEVKLIEQLPQNFFELDTRSQFEFEHFSKKTLSGYLDFTIERPIPEIYTTYRHHFVVKQSALYDEYEAMITAKDAVRAEQSSVEKMIHKGFNNATTLKKLLDMLPEIEMFIPQDALAKHYKKTEPRQRQKIERVQVSAGEDEKVAMAKLKMMGLGGNE